MTSKVHCSSDEMDSVVRKSLLGPVKISCPSEQEPAILHWSLLSRELEYCLESSLPFSNSFKSIAHNNKPPSCTVHCEWKLSFCGNLSLHLCVLGKQYWSGDKSLLSFVAILIRLIWESKLIHEICFHISIRPAGLAAVSVWHSRHWPDLTALSCLSLSRLSCSPLSSQLTLSPLSVSSPRYS